MVQNVYQISGFDTEVETTIIETGKKVLTDLNK